MTPPPVKHVPGPPRAAMEPTEDRPDDVALTRYANDIKMAAMEPAEDRPDDVNVSTRMYAELIVPQWSRPRIGRMTCTPGLPSAWQPSRRNGAGRGSAG